MKRDRGIPLIISGPSGVGKGTVIGRLLGKGNFFLSISATTRSERGKEKDGVEYYFKTRGEFEELIKNDELLEFAQYVGEYYGTPCKPVEEALEDGKDVIFDIDMQGAYQIKKKLPTAVSIFLVPPSFEELERRLRGRGTDTEEKIIKRLEKGKLECFEAEKFDYKVISDDPDRAAAKIIGIIESKRKEEDKNA